MGFFRGGRGGRRPPPGAGRAEEPDDDSLLSGPSDTAGHHGSRPDASGADASGPDAAAPATRAHDRQAARAENLVARELGGTALAAAGTGGIPTPLTVARIVEWFESNGFSYFLDSDGDLGGLWRGRLFYFFLFGEGSEILQIRGQWNREITIERLGEVLEACNEWNADRIWPKAYVRVRDNGMVHVISEVATDLEHGVTDAQLGQLLHCGLSTGNMLFDAIDELYPDPATVAP